MTQGSYNQFCPVAMAAEILCPRWTIVVLRELIAGSTRFNDLRRGVPRMSPALLSQRLKDLEAADIVRRTASPKEPAVFDYQLTPRGRELRPLIEAFGVWGHRWVESELSLQKLDVTLLMWDMRRNLDPSPCHPGTASSSSITGSCPPRSAPGGCWCDPDEGVDLCSIDPGFDVDLYVATDLRTMTAIWMGYDTVRAAVGAQRMLLTGDRSLAASMQTWLALSPFARERKLAS